MKHVVIRIKGGKVNADFTGFQGKQCQQLDQRVRPDEVEIEDIELKPEYHNEAFNTDSNSTEWENS